jgi:hypothetical protein
MSFKEIMEIAYYTSSIGLFIVAILGLKQLKIAKSDIKIRSSRESAHIASEQCKIFIREVLPLTASFDKLLRENKVPSYNGAIKDFMNEELTNASTWYNDWLNKMGELAGKETEPLSIEVTAINALESFSVYFIRGIADETIAFSSVGIVFSNIVERYYPYISLVRSQKNQFNYYDNIIQLYRLWKGRIEMYGLIAQKKNIEQQLKNIPNTHIKPEGTE